MRTPTKTELRNWADRLTKAGEIAENSKEEINDLLNWTRGEILLYSQRKRAKGKVATQKEER